AASGRGIWAVVTHLDHIGVKARYEQALIIRSWVRARRSPVILMGDFNDRPGSAVHRLLSSKETGLQDSWQTLGLTEGRKGMTHHGFSGIPQKTRMDWIMVSGHFRVTRAVIVRDNLQGRYPSDHFPYYTDLEWS
ncbi:MAG: hypothetical protein PHY31_10110, partial [Smithellaceae bacterium]|nr:hypothetical protein [Smithellaceae bacterium]